MISNFQGLHLSTSRNAPDVARLFSGRRQAADPDDRLPPAGAPQAPSHQRKGNPLDMTLKSLKA